MMTVMAVLYPTGFKWSKKILVLFYAVLKEMRACMQNWQNMFTNALVCVPGRKEYQVFHICHYRKYTSFPTGQLILARRWTNGA